MSVRTLRLEVPRDAEGARLDRFLASAIEGSTRSALERLIRGGLVDVDGRTASKPGLALRPGMRLEVRFPPPPPDRPGPETIPLDVAYEDDDLIVVHKPSGIVVHPGHGRGGGTVVNALLGRGTPLAPAGGTARPGIVHRLDRETSGLLVVAKTDLAHRALARAFAERRVSKHYVALVWGHPREPEGRIERGIGRSRANPTRMSVAGTRGRRRAALTLYRVRESLTGFALLDLDLRTGRTHQIRVHLQSIHHPVVGDQRYGGRQWRGVQNPVARGALRAFEGLALHAAGLELRHPVHGTPLRLRSPLPPPFTALLDRLREIR